LLFPTLPPSIEDIYDEHVWHVYAFFAYRVGSRDDAEDLTQMTFERATRALGRYDSKRASILTWLIAIARNLLVDHYRRGTARAQTRPLEDADLNRPDLLAADASVKALGLAPELANALSALSDRDREVVALRYGADLSGPEIAVLTKLSLANVQQILSRALRRMRVLIEEQRALSAD
jgi:RNA polymerase sigma-70 factor (ECF subfamily)